MGRARTGLRAVIRDLRAHGSLWIPLSLTSAGLAASITVLSIFLPVVLAKFTDSQTLIGFAIGGEGLFALALSILIGPLSDRLQTRWGRRRPLMAVGALIAAICLAASPFMPSYWAVVAAVFGFFVGYYLIGIPYRALAPDVLEATHYGRAQGYQQLLRGIGFIIGFGAGSLLFALHPTYPFLIVAGLLVVCAGITIAMVREPASPRPAVSFRRELGDLWRAWRGHRELRRALLANFLFEAGFAGLRTFIVLFFLRGLHLTMYWVTIAVGIVAVANIVGALVAGYLADHFGPRRVLLWFNLINGLAVLIGFFWQSIWMIFVLLPPAAIIGAGVVTLSYPLVMEITPAERRGGYSGIFELARGMGIVIGPVLTGGSIDIYRSLHGAHDGYPAMWLVFSVFSLAAVLVLRWLGPSARERRSAA